MPDIRKGRGHYAVATKAVNHGAACTEDGFVGVAIKQQAAPAGTGLGATAIGQVAIGEQFFIETKGLVYVDNGISAVVGDPLYIVAASNALTKTASTNLKYGRVEAVAGQRGVGTGKMRVNLDAKDGF